MRGLALVLATLFALAALVAAAVHAGPAILGLLASFSCFALTAAASITARDLHASASVWEPRESHGPSHPAPLPPDVVSRKGVFGKMWGVALGAFAVLGIVPFVALARRGTPPGTAWSRGVRVVTADGTPLGAQSLDVGAIATVFPEGHIDAPQTATLLLRLDEDVLRTPSERASWSPYGNIAYSKICTHAGCPVAIYRHESHQLYCPCHQSVFDVLDAAKPVGGPATRALPQLALDVDAHGFLIARGDYAEPVGPDEWDRPL